MVDEALVRTALESVVDPELDISIIDLGLVYEVRFSDTDAGIHAEVDMTLTSPGYKILLEILVKGEYRNFLEVPFVFRNRQFSSSKLNVKEYYLFSKQLLLFSLRKSHRDKR